jgi:hypothetical protein
MANQKNIPILVSIIIIVIAALILLGGVFAYQYFSQQKLNNTNQAENTNSNLQIPNTLLSKSASGCIEAGKVGEFYRPPAVLDTILGKCCGKLTLIPEATSTNCHPTNPAHGKIMICSDCGNGICETWENKCNCPADCK